MLVLMAGLVLSTAGGWAVARELEGTRRREFHQVAVDARTAIERRIAASTEVLFGLRSLLASARPVSRAQFHDYVALNGATHRFPGLIALSFNRRVGLDGLATFEQQVRGDASLNRAGYPTFRVHPPPGGEAIVVDYLEPLEGNEEAFGLDVGSDPVRRVAVEEARDSGDLVATVPIVLVQGRRPGFLTFLAVYGSKTVPLTDPARRRAFLGVATAVFDSKALLGDVLSKRAPVAVEIYDVGPTVEPASTRLEPERLVFDTDSRPQAPGRITGLRDVLDLDVAGRRWRMVAAARPGFVTRSERVLPGLAGLGGTVLSILGASLTWSYSRARRVRRESTFRSFLELAPDAVVVVDREGRVVRANARVEDLFGYREEELVGQPVEVLLPERLRAVHVDHRNDYVVKGPTTRPMGAGLELVGLRKEGSELSVDISLGPLETDEGLLFAAAIRDTTERKRAEATRSRLASIVESSDDSIITSTLDGTIVDWNPAAERMYGYRSEEVVDLRLDFLCLPERTGEIAEALERVARGEVHRYEAERVRKDGTLIDVSITASPIRDASGNVVGASGIARDISERKRLEAARDEFIANAAHELRTPLATLAALGEILAAHLQELTPEQVSRSLAALERQGQRASTLVANLLDLSQIQEGRTRLAIEPVNLAAAVKGALEAAQPPDTTTVGVSVPPDLKVVADALRLEQILTNLLTNAYRYGGDQVAIRARLEGGAALVSVSDDGVGIPTGLVPRLFEPFTRGLTAERHGGSGIGLALCRRLIEALGGDLWYEAAQPNGACFTIRLPCP